MRTDREKNVRTFAGARQLALFALVACLWPAVPARADFITPAGLNPGDQFRIVFVSSATRTATSSNIADYDTFIDNLATAAALTYNGVDVTWFALGSTATVSAISRLPSSASSPALYRLDGVKIADSTSDLWDASIDAPINVNEFVSGGITGQVATGTSTSGTGFGGSALGGSSGITVRGNPSATGGNWIFASPQVQTGQWRVYGYSEVLTVQGTAAVPEPTTLTLVLVGIATWAGATLARRRRRATSPA